MPLESASYISQLNESNPPGTDLLQQADDHIRLIKATLKATFPNITGPITKTQDELNGNLVPIGVINAWYGLSTAIPSGWALCDGSTVTRTDGLGSITTPDLSDTIIIGAGTYVTRGTYAGTTDYTSTSSGTHDHTTGVAGAHTHGVVVASTTLSEAHIPAHSHLMVGAGVSNATLTNTTGLSQERTAGGDTQYIIMGASTAPTLGKTSTVGSGSAHNHTATADAVTDHSHTVSSNGSHTHSISDVLPPVLGLHYIMKV